MAQPAPLSSETCSESSSPFNFYLLNTALIQICFNDKLKTVFLHQCVFAWYHVRPHKTKKKKVKLLEFKHLKVTSSTARNHENDPEAQHVPRVADASKNTRDTALSLNTQFDHIEVKSTSLQTSVVWGARGSLCYCERNGTKLNNPAPLSHRRPGNTNQSHEGEKAKWAQFPLRGVLTFVGCCLDTC